MLPRLHLLCLLLFSYAIALHAGEPTPSPDAPTLGRFLGINGHTVQFKPKLYQPVCALVRDYHGFNWDMGKDTDFKPTFPFARNRVNWNKVYGSWKQEGFDIDVSIMFGGTPHDSWKDLPRDAKAYGKAFASFFGPSSKNPLVTSVEIGNEPGSYPDAKYAKLFKAMASGFREGDPKLKIVTCAATTEKSHKYAKSLTCLKGCEDLYDVINIHVYAQVEGWPTWRRSFPEDPKIDYLKIVKRTQAWRDKNARGKPIWITEYGWDASTKKPPKKGTFAKWIGNNDTQQAQWLVRSTLVFMRMAVDRAYIYFFNDADKPSVHASSGVTRNFKPKPSYHALAHLQKTLGAYCFLKAARETAGDAYVYEFTNEKDAKERTVVVWSPTGSKRKGTTTLDLKGYEIQRAERMPLKPGKAPAVKLQMQASRVTVPVSESPLYIMLRKAK